MDALSAQQRDETGSLHNAGVLDPPAPSTSPMSSELDDLACPACPLLAACSSKRKATEDTVEDLGSVLDDILNGEVDIVEVDPEIRNLVAASTRKSDSADTREV